MKVAIAFLLLAACGGGTAPAPISVAPAPVAVAPAPSPTPVAWEAGPIIDGRNYSVGVPASLTSGVDGPYVDIPQAPGHVDYITFRHGSLAGKSRITLRYRIEADTQAQILPVGYPQYLSAALTLYFQRRGDNWSAAGPYQYYRWYASGQTTRPLAPGSYEVSARLDDVWTPVLTGNSLDALDAFNAAKADADRVGFVLGGGDGLGHGIYATGSARLTITSYVIT